MGRAFHQTLRQLRKNKRFSQRKVASDLYISQALLSHYENGIREPGLDFVNQACTYYDVTADFLLGRTDADVAETLYVSPSGAGAHEVHLDPRALLTLLQSIHQLEQEALFNSVLRCFGAVTYWLLRHMASIDSDTATLFLTVPENRMTTLSDMELHLAEMQFLDVLEQLAAQQKPGTPIRLMPQQLEPLLLALDKQIAQQAKESAKPL